MMHDLVGILYYRIRGYPKCRMDVSQVIDLSQEARRTCSAYRVDAEF
jgi:hypothetical protein